MFWSKMLKIESIVDR